VLSESTDGMRTYKTHSTCQVALSGGELEKKPSRVLLEKPEGANIGSNTGTCTGPVPVRRADGGLWSSRSPIDFSPER